MLRVKGFSFIELMVALGLLAILLVVAIPLYQGYTRSAGDASVTLHIAELEEALQVYTATHDPIKTCEDYASKVNLPVLDDSEVELRLDFSPIDQNDATRGYRAAVVVSADPANKLEVARDIHDAMAARSRVAPGAVLSDTLVAFSVYLTPGDDPFCDSVGASAALASAGSQVAPAPAPSAPVPAPTAPAAAPATTQKTAPPSPAPVVAMTFPDENTCPPGYFFRLDKSLLKVPDTPPGKAAPPSGSQYAWKPGDPLVGSCTLSKYPDNPDSKIDYGRYFVGTPEREKDPYAPVSCHTCVGPLVICESLHRPTVCAWPNNYCGNHTINHIDGTRTVNHFCASLDFAETDWWLGTSDEDKCDDLSIGNQKVDFQCSFVCLTDNCNADVRPSDASLWKPKIVN